MKRKTWKYMIVVSVALLIAGCGSNAKKQTKEKARPDNVSVAIDRIKTLQLDGVQVTWIQEIDQLY